MIVNGNFIVILVVQIKTGIIKYGSVNVNKNENSKYLNSVADASVIECDKIIFVLMYILSFFLLKYHRTIPVALLLKSFRDHIMVKFT